MKFNRSGGSQTPQVNLVPMMDVLMTILTFFIIISMTLTGQAVNVLLPEATPSEGNSQSSESVPNSLVVGLNADGQILLNNTTITTDELVQQMQAYFAENPDGVVALKADRSLDYRDVAELLKVMRDVGGSRVSLAIESN